MPAQHSWPSAACSHLTLFALAQLLLPKAPPEATWKMRSVNWSVLKINHEKKTPNHFTRWLRSSCFSALGIPGRQVEGLELALLQEMACGIPSTTEASGSSQRVDSYTKGVFRSLRYPRYISLKIGNKGEKQQRRRNCWCYAVPDEWRDIFVFGAMKL